MRLIDTGSPLVEATVAACEAELGITLPPTLRAMYLAANGGEPDPYVFENEDLDTVVSEFLPLVSGGRSCAMRCYQRLVLELSLVPPAFFPFAIDGGGDYFFTDTLSSNGDVYFYRGDSDLPDRLLRLNVGIAEFWAALKPGS
jgi:cell wall assembly regulator SMI1